MLTYGQITPHIMAQIEDYILHLKVLKDLEPVLKGFDEKVISKRIETAVLKVRPDLSVYLDRSLNFSSLKVWGGGIPYDKRLSLLLSYDTVFNFEKYLEYNRGYYNEEAEKNKLAEYLDDCKKQNELMALIERFNNAKKEIEAIEKQVPDIYPIRSFFKF